ncbi:MAG: asparagine synthase (glutamine-hydrolyzing) [Planctomycetota bacterium]
MCGIAGIVSTRPGEPPLPDAARVVSRMAGRIVHRGPDGSGVWSDPTGGVHFAHRRLAVIDLSDAAAQPMVDDVAQLAITFNGEIYNYRELRTELEAAGAAFRTQSDTEVILRAYQRWGRDCVTRLVGMFAFAIHDARQQLVWLARDRAGEKPLYWTSLSPAGFGYAFASEPAALDELPGVTDRPINAEAVAYYLRFQYLPAGESIRSHVYKLRPARTLAISLADGAVSQAPYWNAETYATAPRLTLSDDDALDELHSLMRRSVAGQMIADVPLGAFLSGGIDSSTIVGLMRERGPVRTFTIAFDDPSHDESAHAAAVAKHLGTEHTCETLSLATARDLIPSVPAMFGEPFADSSALPTQLVSRVARRHVTVSLSGDGADEAFGGYARYERMRSLSNYHYLLRALRPILRILGSPVGSKHRAVLHKLGQTVERFEESASSILPFEVVQSLCGQPPIETDEGIAWLDSLERRLMQADLVRYLPGAILTKVDRAAMACSLETRAPFLDHRVLEFALKLPLHLVRGKRILHRLAERYVPRELLDRPKQGFAVPLARWFRGELQPMLRDMLVPANLEPAGVTGQRMVQTLIEQHVSGTRDWSAGLWALLVLAMWVRDR